ncbi:DUF2461 domain-containing protein [Rhodothermus marinus]|uniref:TIGR02453 family protein n=1 Tax=Rhodothermus marinus (strain ATCC 43812 / DSM 4252 / R-10) TaxID=518766 RepID=D0MEZ5_RHOM4|nr:TIGR02453 family protein [Rhodothermus marinus]ACY47445.1 conserved hypothetical protein [Rhodothermus marinus DSM 4252]
MTIPYDFPPFPGFRPEALDFLRALKQHNRREWFKPRKAIYEDEVRWPMQCLVADVGRELARRGLPLRGDPELGLFRIYRDTRFSKDKRPYKTHIGAVLSRTGSRRDLGVVYIHVEPGESFLGAGFWKPDATFLRRWRRKMVQESEAFLEIVHQLRAHGLTLETDTALKRMPRGFEEAADSPVAEYLRWNSFLVSQDVPDEAVRHPEFAQTVLRFAEIVLPLLEFGWDAADT